MNTQLLQRIAKGRTDLIINVLKTGSTNVLVEGASLLQWCAYYGDVSALRILLNHGESLQQLGTDLGINAAAFHGHWRLSQYLLEQGAPVDGVAGETGETPLHAALCTTERRSHDQVVKLLLAAGADVHARTANCAPTGAFMRDCRTRGETALHRAAAFGGTETIQLLLDAGAKQESTDAHGDTPLSWASWYRRPPAILRLLCYGPFQIHPQYQSMQTTLTGKVLLD